jgi:hypothetical protein
MEIHKVVKKAIQNLIVYKMSMNKDAEINAQRQSYNVTSRTIQVSNRAVYNNNNNKNNSSVGIATELRAGRPGGGGSSSSGRVKNFHFSISSRPALGSTQPPIKWVPGAFSRG